MKKVVLFISRGLLIALITLLLLEAVLQLAARMVEKRIHPLTGMEVPADGTLRIVMMGDSNTYGLYLKEEDSYPKVFERTWNEKNPERPVQVINLGFPGTNSSRVLKSFPDVIRTFAPDIITVMVGVNDFWMAPVNVEEVDSPVSALEGWCRDHLRTYKLIYMLQRQLYNEALLHIDPEPRSAVYDPSLLEQYQASLKGEAPPLTADKPSAIQYGGIKFDVGYVLEVGRQQNPAEDIKRNLLKMAEIAQASQVKLVLITYAYYDFPQKTANWQMKAVAKEKKVALVNPARIFREECAKGKPRCEALFFPDYHPTAEGYRLLALEIEKYFQHSRSAAEEPL